MPEPDFEQLGRQLQRAGVAQGYVRRSVDELSEHYDALVAELVEQGIEPAPAREQAARRLGELPDIARAISARRELKSWYYRWPGIARIALPVACIAALPATPVIAGMQHATELFRWSCCLLLSGLVTVLLFGIMQLPMQLS